MNRDQILSALTFSRRCLYCLGSGKDDEGSSSCPDCGGTGCDPLVRAVQAVGWMLMRMPGLDQTWAGDDGATDAERAATSLQGVLSATDPRVTVRVDSHRLVVWSPGNTSVPAAFAGFPVLRVTMKPEAGRSVEPLENGKVPGCVVCSSEATVCCHCPDCSVASQTDRYAACSAHMFEARKAHDKFRDHMVIWGTIGRPRRSL